MLAKNPNRLASFVTLQIIGVLHVQLVEVIGFDFLDSQCYIIFVEHLKKKKRASLPLGPIRIPDLSHE
jgi:hypothetical protein